MMKKILLTLSLTLFSGIISANAAIINLMPNNNVDVPLLISTTDTFQVSAPQGDEGTGFTHTFTFTPNFTNQESFFISTTNDNGNLNTGVGNLVLTWLSGGVGSYAYTDALGVFGGTVNPFFENLVAGTDAVLQISGDWLSNGGAYAITVSAVPLPPAVIAFATAMLGVGYLARRKRKKKALFA